MNLTEDKKQEQLESLLNIKNLMEQSARFTALSGASGISAGIIAVFGCLYAAFQLNFPIYAQAQSIMRWGSSPGEASTVKFLITTGLLVFVLALAAFLFFAGKKAKRNSMKLFNSAGRKFIFNHSIFLLSGGLFAAILFYYGFYLLIVPSLLIFYGLALVNISKFSFSSIRNLGILEILLGFILCLAPVYALLFFFIGFGVLHIVYGLILHLNYDRQAD
ncbi:MAG: hypothetical protein K1X86_09290 [Ignavibacteria bacterium]|nr:hypothetical protein [Ignavibacteria bacterium]